MNRFSSPEVPGVGERRPLRLVPPRIPHLLGPALAGAVLALSVSAQGASPALLVSTSVDVAGGGTVPTVDDAALVRVRAGEEARVMFLPGHWQGVTGDVPGDVDGLALRPGADPADHRALAFTLQADEGGFLDGDVLGLAEGGGFEVLVFESDLLIELGAGGAAIDLDAIAFDDQGRLLFSLQSNLASSLLGPIDDGDVLRLEIGGGVTRPFTEADVQAGVAAATGSGSAIGDVLGMDWVAGELWVSVQSPTANDGSVISLGSTPAVVLDEADAGLGGAELDAFVRLDSAGEIGTLSFSADVALPGDTLMARFRGGVPGAPLFVIVAGNSGYFSTLGVLEGFGGLYFDPADPWFNMFSQVPVVMLDASGSLDRSVVLPSGSMGGTGFDGSAGWTFQTIDSLTLEVSAPFRVEL